VAFSTITRAGSSLFVVPNVAGCSRKCLIIRSIGHHIALWILNCRGGVAGGRRFWFRNRARWLSVGSQREVRRSDWRSIAGWSGIWTAGFLGGGARSYPMQGLTHAVHLLRS
jgi:hypothetical protein